MTAGGGGAVVAVVSDAATAAREGVPGPGKRPPSTQPTPAKGGAGLGIRRERRGVEGAPSGARR